MNIACNPPLNCTEGRDVGAPGAVEAKAGMTLRSTIIMIADAINFGADIIQMMFSYMSLISIHTSRGQSLQFIDSQ
jgi:hypothetical protein